MQKSVPLVKATILNLVKSGSEIPKWVLTSFNEPNVVVESPIVTEDSEELQMAVQSLVFRLVSFLHYLQLSLSALFVFWPCCWENSPK